MLNRSGRRYWSRRVPEDRPESQVKDTRIATADLDTAVDTAIDTAVDIPIGTAGLPSPVDNWRARHTWKVKKLG